MFRQLIEAWSAKPESCKLDKFLLEVFIDQTIMSFVNFFKKKTLTEDNIEKGRYAMRIFLSAWQLSDGIMDEIITTSYLSAVKKICCVQIPAGKSVSLMFFSFDL